MGDPLYRPILKQAWQITLKNKAIWFFGLFVAILGIGGEYEIINRAMVRPGTGSGIISGVFEGIAGGLADGLALGGGLWSNIVISFSQSPGSIVIITLAAIIALAITLFFIWLSVVCQIGIIKNTSLIAEGKKPTINEGIDFAVQKFWPVLLADIILKVILFILLFLMAKELLLLTGEAGAGTALYYISFVVFVAAILVISFIIRYQVYFMLLHEQKFWQAWESAWELFKKNWLTSLEMGFILFVAYLIAALASSLVTALFMALPFVMALALWPFWLITLVSVVGLIIMVAVVLLITAMLMTFQWSSWTLLFNRLTGKEAGISRIIRSAGRLAMDIGRK